MGYYKQSVYRGDYYRGARGDYYRGARGDFLDDLLSGAGSVLGAVGKGVVQGAGSILSEAARGAFTLAGGAPAGIAATVPGSTGTAATMPAAGRSQILQTTRGATFAAQGLPSMATAAMVPQAGYPIGQIYRHGHYYVGPVRTAHRKVDSWQVKARRSMNVCNMRALRRALRRSEGFKHLAMRTIRLLDPHRKAKKFGGFKHHRKRHK